MIIKELEIEGFCTIIKRQTIRFQEKGLTVVQGANGAGKTQIFSALMWVIYGSTLKPNNSVTPLKPPKKFRGTYGRVAILTENGRVDILRTIDYKGSGDTKKSSKLTLAINGEIFPQGKVETRKKIIEVLGMSPLLFKNTIIFPQRTESLTRLSNSEKKEIFTEAFEAYFISRAREIATAKKKEIDGQILPLQHHVGKYQDKIKSTKEAIKEIEEMLASFEDEKAKIVAKLKLRLKGMREKHRKVKDIKAEIEEVKGKLASHRKSLGKTKEEDTSEESHELSEKMELKGRLASRIQQYQKDLKHLRKSVELVNTKAKVCIECGQPITSQIHQEQVKKKRKEIKQTSKKLEAVRVKLTNINARILTLENTINIKEKRNSNRDDIESAVVKLESKLSALELEKYASQHHIKEVNTLKLQINEEKKKKLKTSKIPVLKRRVEAYTNKLGKYQADLDKVLEKSERYNWVLKTPLSNQGLSAFIFENMLKAVNARLKEYSKATGIRLKFSVNLASHRKEFFLLIYHEDTRKEYEDLSGGEAQLVDVSASFAINDVANVASNTNILVLDEVFEGLDTENVEVIYKLIEAKARTKNIWLVTHNKAFVSANANLVTVEKTPEGTLVS